VTETFASSATPPAPFAGEVAVTEGGRSVGHGLSGAAVFRGFGAPSAKSTPLVSVSWQPPAARMAAVVLVVIGPTVPSKKFAPSQPMRSTIVARAAGEQAVLPPLQASGVVVLTRATLPPPAAMLIGVKSVTSGAGSGGLTVVPAASCTRRYCPGARVPERGVMRFVAEPKLPVPVADVYWTDQPASERGAVPRLNSSMKSFWYGAPVLPPPP